MEMYKCINRALSIQNQELRQQVAQLKEEIVYLNRTVMNAREENEVLRRTILRCVSEASNALRQIVNEINPIECDRQLGNKVPVTEPQLDSNFTNSRLSDLATQRSIHPVAPTLRQSFDRSDCDKENTNPSLLGDEESVERISYVQVRRRRPPDVSTASTMAEESPIQSSVLVDESEYDEQSHAESENFEISRNDSINRDIPTIIEENTIIDSLTSHSLDVPIITRTLINNRSRNQNSIAIEDTTTFDNFSALKATSSTPYKKYNNATSDAYMRSVRVVIPKLKQTDLELLTQSSVNSTHRKAKTPKDKQKKNVSKKQSTATKPIEKSDIIMDISSCVLTERSSNISNERNERPKRHAAPVSLREPSLNLKLRRKT